MQSEAGRTPVSNFFFLPSKDSSARPFLSFGFDPSHPNIQRECFLSSRLKSGLLLSTRGLRRIHMILGASQRWRLLESPDLIPKLNLLVSFSGAFPVWEDRRQMRLSEWPARTTQFHVPRNLRHAETATTPGPTPDCALSHQGIDNDEAPPKG